MYVSRRCVLVVVALGAPLQAQTRADAGDSVPLWRLGVPPVQGAAFPRLQAVERANAQFQNMTTIARVMMLLSPDSAVPDTLVQRFLGRPVNYEAFYRELGLTAPRQTISRPGSSTP